MAETKQYTVVILFNSDGSKVLLQTKDRTIFAGKLNGVGGKVEKGEITVLGAIREIQEETTLVNDDIENFTWLGTLIIPESCDNSKSYPELLFYAGIVKDESKASKAQDATEEVNWYCLGSDNKPFTNLELAGDGDLLYFIGKARRLLFGKNPVDFE